MTLSKDNLPSVKLIDFGLSLAYTKDIKNAHITGTPGYIAPEILMRYSFDEKIDIYSCGIVLYFMLAGTCPFSSNSMKQLMHGNRRNKITFDKHPWISEGAKKFILQLTDTIPCMRLSASKALENEWLNKAMSSLILCKTKPIVKLIEESISSTNSDSYGICNVLARTVSHVIVDMHLLEEEVKANKIPELVFQHSILDYDRQSASCKHRSKNRKVKKHFSRLNVNMHFTYEEKQIEDLYLPNIKNTRKMLRVPKERKKSKFAIKTNSTTMICT